MAPGGCHPTLDRGGALHFTRRAAAGDLERSTARRVAMAVVGMDITSRTAYAEGLNFGTAGAYERIEGVFEFAVDPGHEANVSIVDLALAPRDADGKVRFSADFALLSPVQPAAGNGRLIVDVVNRGRKNTVPTFNLAVPSRVGTTEIPVGDGFLFTSGYSVVSIGWQWDVYRSELLMGLDAPVAPVKGKVLVELRPDVVQTTRALANRVHRPTPTADVDDPTARLLVRDWEDGPYTEIPRNEWRFAQETSGGVETSAEHIYMAAGFQPGKIYHVVYNAEGSPVVGAGLLAIRDGASFLRHPSSLNPIESGYERAYAYGVSQTGRLLRHFVYLGLNVDEQGRQVYDGLLPHVAGARRGEFNMRFAQPSVQSTPGFAHLYPFADDVVPDPFSEAAEGLLDRERAQGTAPRIIYTNTAAEYWRGDASLVHMAPGGERDLGDAEESRVYLFAGTQHADARQLPAPGDPAIDGTLGRYEPNNIDYRPLLRAALVNLDRWVSQGVEPPPSKHPRVDDGTALSPRVALATHNAVKELAKPDPDRLWSLRETQMGPQADEGIAALPVEEGRAYECCVSAVDIDGNEIAGIRLPDVAVPLATHAGWNPRHPDTGSAEQIIPMVGFSIPFAATADQREATDDLRPSVQERYANRDAYVAFVRAHAESLAVGQPV